MTEQEAQLLVDRLLSSANPRQKLNNIQSVVLEKTWAGYSYQEIAEELGYQHDYIRQIGFQLWRTLSQAVGEEVSKKNVQAVLRRYAALYATTSGTPEGTEAIAPFQGEVAINSCELQKMSFQGGANPKSSSVGDSLRSGIAARSAIQNPKSNDDRPTFEGFASQLLGQQKPSTSQLDRHPEQLVNDLVTHLQNHPCLCILDMVEEILTPSDGGELQYRDPLFAKFFDRLLEVESMPSRLILTSQDRPPAIAEGRYKERSHLEELKGLNPAEAIELFRVWEVYPQREEEVEFCSFVSIAIPICRYTNSLALGDFIENKSICANLC
jgi:hypothetical protein